MISCSPKVGSKNVGPTIVKPTRTWSAAIHTNSSRSLNNVASDDNGCMHDINNAHSIGTRHVTHRHASKSVNRSNTLRWTVSDRHAAGRGLGGTSEKCKSFRSYARVDVFDVIYGPKV